MRPDRTTRRRQRLTAVVAVLLLAVLAFAVTVISVAGRAGSTPAPITTAPAPPPNEYIPTPAGPPSSSPTGGDR